MAVLFVAARCDDDVRGRCELDLEVSWLWSLDVLCFFERSGFLSPSKKPRFGLGLLRSCDCATREFNDDVGAPAPPDDDVTACCRLVGIDLVRMCLLLLPPDAFDACDVIASTLSAGAFFLSVLCLTLPGCDCDCLTGSLLWNSGKGAFDLLRSACWMGD